MIGINVNLRGVYNISSNFQTQAVRFVLDRFDGKQVNSLTDTINNHYQPFVDNYLQRGIKPIVVINQQTWGDGGQVPWPPYQSTSWEKYAREFGNVCGIIARRWRDTVIYQIGNEHDIRGESSVFWEPQHYALVLREAVKGIRQEAPNAVIYSHGHAGSAHKVLTYWRAVEQTYNKPDINAIAVHPYGQYLTAQPPPIRTGWFGNLRDYWATVSRLDRPLVVTEIGVSEPHGFSAEEHVHIANYMRQTYEWLSSRTDMYVWFAWSTHMRGAGIVDHNNQPLQPTYNTFLSLVNEQSNAAPTGSAYEVVVARANLRQFPTVNSQLVGQATRGQVLKSDKTAQEQWEALRTTMRYPETWYAVTLGNGIGFIRSDLVKPL